MGVKALTQFLEPPVYFCAVAIFWTVIFAVGRMEQDLLLIACIPAVFVAIVMGFIMGIYALDSFGVIQALISAALGWIGARELARRYAARDLAVAIHLVWAAGLVVALVATNFPDNP